MFIGITTRIIENDNKLIEKVPESLIQKVIEAGGIPLIIPLIKEKDLPFFLNVCKGFVIPGGNTWHNIDEIIIKHAINYDIPLLGICAGMQAIGNLKNFIGTPESDKTIIIKKHNHNSNAQYAHDVYIKGTLLKNILKENIIKVNSRHNSQIKKESFFQIEAISPDNIIEAISIPGKKFILGLQWHPEDLNDSNSLLIFKSFIDKCKIL